MLYPYCQLLYKTGFGLQKVGAGIAQSVVSYYGLDGRVGGVVVSVLATGPKSCGFEPGQGDGLLGAIKIGSTPSSRMGSEAGRSHVVRFYGM
jgi:hypothetical protein